jgi:hypothetical protein
MIHGTVPSRPDVAPLPHGRSASHAFLPTAYSSTSIPDQNPLDRPSRPLFPQSLSTTALPSEASSSKAPYVGRFATGPIRIVRPAPVPSHDDTDLNGGITIGADGFMYTPSGATVFGGPSRPPPHAQAQLGHGRKPIMGIAHRRVVTAPLESGGLGLPARTPAANKLLTRSVKGKVEEVEEFPFSIPVAQAVVTNPQTPAPVSKIAQDSPILPVLRANAASQAERVEDVRETSMIQDSIEMIRELEGPVPVELAAQIPLPPDEVNEVNEVAVSPSSVDTIIVEEPTSKPSADLVEVILLEKETPLAQMSMAAPAAVADEEAESPPHLVIETIHRPIEEVDQVEAAPTTYITEPTTVAETERDATVKAGFAEHVATDISAGQRASTPVPATVHREAAPVEILQPSSLSKQGQQMRSGPLTTSASGSMSNVVLQGPAPVDIVSEPIENIFTAHVTIPSSSTSIPPADVGAPKTLIANIIPDPIQDIAAAPLSNPSSSTTIPPIAHGEAPLRHVGAQITSPADIIPKPIEDVHVASLTDPTSSTSTPPITNAEPVSQHAGSSQPKVPSTVNAPKPGATSNVIPQELAPADAAVPSLNPASSTSIPPVPNSAMVSRPAGSLQPKAGLTANAPKAGAAPRVVSGRLATSRPAQIASSSTAPAPAPTAAPPRKPPVPRAAAVSRTVRPVERKPFRPATAAQTAALAKSRVVSQPAAEKPAESSSNTSSKPPAAEPRSRQASASSSQAGSTAAPAKVATSTTAPTARAITKPSTLLAPTKASASRAGPTVSQPRIPSSSTTTSSALPPVRKEKIKLKAALPSFRPVRSGAAASQTRSTSGPGPTLGNGTIKSSSSNRSTTSQPAARVPVARVRPETIPLPHSPVSAASRSSKQVPSQVRPEQVALPASPADRLATKVRPEAMPLPPSPAEKAPISANAKKSVVMTLGTSSSRHIRITPAEAVPLPDSPIARDEVISTTESEPSSTAAASQAALPLSSTQTATEVPLPDSPLSDAAQLTRSRVARHSVPQVIALQQAERGITPTPSASTMSDLDSDLDSEEGDDLTGVTFKVRPDGPQVERAMKLKPKVYLPTAGDLMDFSPSSKTVMFDKLSVGSTTPKYTPGRKALVSRDANVSSPLVMRGPLVDEEDDEDW